jgi:hypothetical protein
LSGFAQTKEAKTAEFEWEKIVPLVTKKAEVENYFGKPYRDSVLFSSYDTNSGRISVFYRGLEDSKELPYKCNASSDTVRDFHITLTKAIPIEGLGWNLDKFNKAPRDAEIYVYSYVEKGIYFTAFNGQDGKELVTTITYKPSYTNIKNKCIKK